MLDELTTPLAFLGTISFAIGVGLLAYAAARTTPFPRPTTGPRGRERTHALEQSTSFRVFEPVMRFVAAGCTSYIPRKLRAHTERLLVQSGDPLGLAPEEFVGASTVLAMLAGITGACFARAMGIGLMASLPAAFLGALVPYTRVADLISRRKKIVSRALPNAIDLLALCMTAGIDFTAGLKLLLADLPERDETLRSELSHMVQAMELGHTRREALIAFSERVPSDAVQDFVRAVMQAERTGTPLATVLEIQARVLRARRTVQAEESASRAAVLLLLPLFLLLATILLVLFGPFIVQGVAL